jgi:hypothetical protein
MPPGRRSRHRQSRGHQTQAWHEWCRPARESRKAPIISRLFAPFRCRHRRLSKLEAFAAGLAAPRSSSLGAGPIANKRFPIGERQIDTRLDDLDSGIADQYVNAAFLTTKACLKHMYSYPSRFSAARSWTRNHWRDLQRDEVTRSCGEVNDLIARLLGETLPTVCLAHRNLARGQQSPEQHGGGFCGRQHGLRLDPPLELLVQSFDCIRCSDRLPLAFTRYDKRMKIDDVSLEV